MDAPTVRTIVSRAVDGGFVVCVHGTGHELADPEWDEFIGLVEQTGQSDGSVNVLVDTPGSGPSVMQRAKLHLLTQRFPIRLAVMTNAPRARAIIKVVGWMAKVDVKRFAPADIADACAYLKASDEQRKQLTSTTATLLRTVGR